MLPHVNQGYSSFIFNYWYFLTIISFLISVVVVLLRAIYKKQIKIETEKEEEILQIQDKINLKICTPHGFTVHYDKNTVSMYLRVINLSSIDIDIQSLTTRFDDAIDSNNFSFENGMVNGSILKAHTIGMLKHERTITDNEKKQLCKNSFNQNSISINCNLIFSCNGEKKEKGFTEHALVKCSNCPRLGNHDG